MFKTTFSSLARIADFSAPYVTEPVPLGQWRNGDYVAAEVSFAEGDLARIELPNGRMTELVQGDLIIGALGERAATLEVVGSFRDVGPDYSMQLLTAGGLCGKRTSKSRQLPSLVQLE